MSRKKIMQRSKTQNNLIILLSTLVLILIGSTLLFSRENKAKSFPRRNVIELREYGFYPEEITVKKGETVTFLTRRELPFWPASDPHPIHDTYPEFDSKKAIMPGETWSFTFDKVGSWGFHDHLAAYYSTDAGVVHVVEDGQAVLSETFLPSYEKKVDCNDNENSNCWIGNLKATLLEEGVVSAFNLLSEYYDKNPEFVNNCNAITHYLGGFAYRVYKDNKKDIVVPEAVFCNAGFFHGFMEVWFHNYPKIEEATNFCKYVDDKLGEEKVHATYACYHGLGHGAYHSYLISDWTLFSQQLEPTIEICEKSRDLGSCLDGMFNAVQMDYYLSRYRDLDEKEDPLQYCESLEKYKWECYDGMASIYLWSGEGELSDVKKVIDRIEEDDLATAALQTLVQIYSFKNTSSNDHQEIVGFCHNLRDSLTRPCLRAYATGLVEQGSPGEEYLGGFSFCSTSTLTKSERDDCYHYITDYSLTYYSGKERGRVCSALTGEYKDYCLERLTN